MTGNSRSARVARGVVLFLALALPVSARAQARQHALTVVVQPDRSRLAVEDVITPPDGERPPHGVYHFLLNAGLRLTASTPDVEVLRAAARVPALAPLIDAAAGR